MRHADDLFNASESIISAPTDADAHSKTDAALANGAGTGTTAKSVQLKTSALTPGRGGAVAGGAWGKVEVKTRSVRCRKVIRCLKCHLMLQLSSYMVSYANKCHCFIGCYPIKIG